MWEISHAKCWLGSLSEETCEQSVTIISTQKCNCGGTTNSFAGDRPSKPRLSEETVGCTVVQEVERFLRREPVHGGLRRAGRPSGCPRRGLVISGNFTICLMSHPHEL